GGGFGGGGFGRGGGGEGFGGGGGEGFGGGPFGAEAFQSLDTLPIETQRAVEVLRSKEPYDGSTVPDYIDGVPFTLGLKFPKELPPEIAPDGVPIRNPSIVDLENCPSCVPSDPSIGLATFSGLPDVTLPNRLQRASSGAGDGVEKSQIEQCGAAVQALRAPVSPMSGNMIDDFYSACLKELEVETYPQLDDIAKQEVSACLAAHILYEQSCLQHLDTIVDKRVVGRIGMLFNIVDKDNPRPACTATLLTETLIVTARHCYTAEALGLPGGTDGTAALAFTPNPILLAATNVQSMPAYIEVAGEVTLAGEHQVDVVPETPQPSEDVIALRLKTPVALESPRLEIIWANLELGKELTLIGFQELALRRTLLEARIKNVGLTSGKSLIEEGAFSAFLRVDHGPMCIVGDLTPGQFGHYCQSFNGTSGAPIFLGNLALPQNSGFSVALVGFQSRGNASDMPDKEVIGPPNTAAQVTSDLATLLGLR
ncbi:trypsin-like serine peptidase, partial [Sinorhizobium meliloti]|uniref:trypsin-like serine peptidase n=1 Tax=Rhizobium meliloti TaxID=382 RepID=UPI000FE08260